MRSRKTNSHNSKRARYRSEKHTENNAARRAQTHQQRLEKQAELKETRLQLQDEVCKLLKVNVGGLKKLIGTPNIKRLTAVKENSYLNSAWFLARQAKQLENQNAKKTVHHKKKSSNKKLSLRREGKKSNKKISNGPDRGDK